MEPILAGSQQFESALVALLEGSGGYTRVMTYDGREITDIVVHDKKTDASPIEGTLAGFGRVRWRIDGLFNAGSWKYQYRNLMLVDDTFKPIEFA